MKRKRVFQTIVLLLLFLPRLVIAQEESTGDLTETEKLKQLEEEHRKTGIEAYIQYPIPIYSPGWIFITDTDHVGPLTITYPGINVSFINLNMGVDMDFGSQKMILRNMGVGIAMEMNILDSWHMKGYELGLLQTYSYLFYLKDTKRFIDHFYRIGLGLAVVSNGEIFDTEQEKENPIGPLFVVETGTAWPALGDFRLYSGLSYKLLPINSKNIHILSPFIRAAYRL